MSGKPIPVFGSGSIENVARSIGDLYTGSVLTRVITEAKLAKHDPGEGVTKWRRVAEAVGLQQNHQQDGQPLISMVISAMKPERHTGDPHAANRCRDEINVILSLSGLTVHEDGTVHRVSKATTLDEAQRRAKLMRSHLERTGAHAEVLKQCRPELLKSDHYEAVFESIKGLGARIRKIGDVDLDGRKLIQATMLGQVPTVKINDRITETQKNEQTGVALLAEGLFAAFRNPTAHEPRLTWTMSEQDAFDVLGIVSLIHRRLDAVDEH